MILICASKKLSYIEKSTYKIPITPEIRELVYFKLVIILQCIRCNPIKLSYKIAFCKSYWICEAIDLIKVGKQA